VERLERMMTRTTFHQLAVMDATCKEGGKNARHMISSMLKGSQSCPPFICAALKIPFQMFQLHDIEELLTRGSTLFNKKKISP